MLKKSLLLIAAVAGSNLSTHTAAQEAVAERCRICQDNDEEIQFPNVVVEGLGQTCSELVEEASYYTDPISCRYYHRYGSQCGCKNNRPPPETFCDLCQDATPISNPDRLLEGYEGTCGTLAVDAAWNLWQTLDENIIVSGNQDFPLSEHLQQLQENQSNCNYYHHAGQLCGCRNNRPPKTGCHLCTDGTAPRSGRKSVTPDNAAEATCQAYSLFTHYLKERDTQECDHAQAVVGPYCGCSTGEREDTYNTGTIGTANTANTISKTISTAKTPTKADVCNFCPTGMVTKDARAPSLDLADGSRVFYFRDASCIKVAMLATKFDFECQNIPADFVDACCEALPVPVEDLLNQGDVFLQNEPSIHTDDALDWGTVIDAQNIDNAANTDDEVVWDSVFILTYGTGNTSSSLRLFDAFVVSSIGMLVLAIL